ncbi:MAG: Flp pilus assembly complex ATPase component TadA [Candidatus Omnitrophica bacterium]|nr:Flp pilus assembly complex ATPase component TadA [Candidatus Omnitrophota bacterium]
MELPDRIIQLLESLGLMRAEQLNEAVRIQARSNQRLSQVLQQLGYIKDESVEQSLASQLDLPPTRLHIQDLDLSLAKRMESAYAYEQRVVPVATKGDMLVLATDRLFNVMAGATYSEVAGSAVKMVFSSTADLDKALKHLYPEGSLHAAADAAPIAPSARAPQEQSASFAKGSILKRAIESANEGEEGPVIQLVNSLVEDALERRASDIHLEALDDAVRIRYRVDGVLQEVLNAPKRLHGPISGRFKIMASMDIAEKRLPQDGRVAYRIAQKSLDMRVSTLPGLHGECMVLRLLEPTRVVKDLSELCMRKAELDAFEQVLDRPYGMLLVTGPTGGGKTTTLYAALQRLNTPKKKLITVEDPVEYQIEGINQVQVRNTVGLGFAQGLRSMLRQAPDVIMVGEIRDSETAQISIQAALTGHLVLSTLHTNDAPGAVTRLVDMGVPSYLVAATVQGVVAQRLVRSLCPECREPKDPSLAERALLEEALGSAPHETQLWKAKGCESCFDTGYLGRIGIFELLVMDEPMRELVVKKAGRMEYRKRAFGGKLKDMRADGMFKALEGKTTLEEVVRVTQGNNAGDWSG